MKANYLTWVGGVGREGIVMLSKEGVRPLVLFLPINSN